MRLDEETAPAPGDARGLTVDGPVESLTWGNLISSGDVVLGTVVQTKYNQPVLAMGRDFSSHNRDYTGPAAAKVLEELGLDPESRHVFALDKESGRLRWQYTAQGAVPHNGLIVAGGRVYLLDRPATADAARDKRRGAATKTKPALVVLDLATGEKIRQSSEGIENHVALRLGKGTLLATNLRGMTALDAESGAPLWSVDTTQPMHHCSAFVRAPVIAGDWVYDEPHAYRLRTGERRNNDDGKPWRWGGFRGCGTVSASENLLLYRTSNPAMLDVTGGTGQHLLPGIRPGCYINMITAGGLVLMPEASSGCGCAYNFQTTVVLSPRVAEDDSK
jgi:outer membrane protein assembly factor BamB